MNLFVFRGFQPQRLEEIKCCSVESERVFLTELNHHYEIVAAIG